MTYVKISVAFLMVAVLVYGGLALLGSFTPEAFSLLAAAILSVVFERLSFVADAYQALDKDTKQMVMFLLLGVLVFGSLGLSCLGILPAFDCSQAGVLNGVVTLALCIGVNQGTHTIQKKFNGA